MNELVSIIVPVYNRASKIERALRSIEAQTYPHWEVIVIDDGSTDGTPEVVKRIAEKDRRIRLIRHECNRGAQAARNTGIRAAKGEWIAFLDSDDEWLPHSLKVRLEEARRRNVKVVHSDCYVIKEDGSLKLYGIPPLAGWIYREVLARPGPMFPSLLVHNTALRRIGLLDERIIAYQEWDTAIRLAKYYPFSFIPEPTFIYDCRGTDTISRDTLKNAIGYEQVIRKHLWSILRNLGPRALSNHYFAAAFRYRKAGHRFDALRCEIIAWLYWPLRPRMVLWRLKRLLR